MEIRTDGADDRLVVELIGAAVLAAAYRQLAFEFAGHGGFVRLADKHSRRVKALAGEICGREVVAPRPARERPGGAR